MKKKIIVTGGAGFIGSHLVDSLVKLDHKVIIIDNLTNGKKENINPKASFYKVDITDKDSVEKIILKEKPQIIYHLAAQTKVINSINDPYNDLTTNVLGTLNILESVKKIKEFEKIIFSSSGGAIYGEKATIPTSENSLIKPISPYGISKQSCELYIESYFRNFGINYVILRYSNVYGPRQVANGEGGVIAIFCEALVNKKIVKIFGDGKQTRDYIFVEDVINANIQALNKNIIGIFNIGTGVETTVNKLFSIISGKNKAKAEYLPYRPGELLRSCLDINYSRKVLKIKKTTSIKNGLSKTIEWYKKTKKSSK